MEDKIFDTDDKKATAVAEFASLKMQPGWRTFSAILQTNIDVISNLLSTSDFTDINEVNRLQDRRRAYQDALNTPDMIIDAFSPREDGDNTMSADPFQNIVEFRKELQLKRKS